jgi:tetratricopeptide (TPR) repeat protein
LIVGTYRPEDVAQGRGGERHPLASVASEFKRYYGDTWVDLDQAAVAEGRQFVDALLDTEPNRLDENFRQALFLHTRGHSLFTIELLRDMQERGDLLQDETGRWIEGSSLSWDALTARVEGVIEKRIGRLAEGLREILAVASVEGVDFTAQVIARVQEIRERRLLRDLSRELGKRHRLVQEREELKIGSQLLSRYRFAHALFQQYLYNGLSAGERRLLHGEVAQVLEELYGDQVKEMAVQLARHFREAGIAEQAIDYLLQAGDKAIEVFAWQEARESYETSLEFLEAGNLAQRAAVLHKLATTTFAAGDHDASLSYAQTALKLYEELSDEPNQLAMHMHMPMLYTSGAWDGAKEYRALEHLEKAAAILEGKPDSIEKGLVYQRTGHMYLHWAEPVQTLKWAQKAVDLFAKLGVPMGTALGTALTYTGRIDEGIVYSEGNWDAVHKLGNPFVTAIFGHELSLILALMRDIPRARKWGERVLPEVVKSGLGFEGFLRRPLALIYALSGEGGQAEETCQAVEEIESKSLAGCFFEDAAGIGLHYLRRGKWDKAREYLEQAIATHQGRKNFAAVVGCSFVLGSLNLELGNHHQAEELLLSSLEICRNGGNVLFELWVLPVLAELYLRLGQPDKAGEYVEQGFDLLQPDQNWYGLPAPMYLAKGMLATTKQDWDEAAESFEQAVAINRQYQLPWDEAKTFYEWGLMHLSRGAEGDREKADEVLGQALALFQRIGARKDVEKVVAKKKML